MSYTKLFGSLLDSSIWQEGKHVKILWITLLAMKDRDGEVEASVPGLARRAGLSIDETVDGLKVLLAPDPWSRTPDHEGRRLVEMPGGWRVLNHDKYRDKEDLEERRAKGAARVARHRERAKQDVTPSNAGNAPQRPVAPSDAEAYALSDLAPLDPSTPSYQPPPPSGLRADRDQAPPPVSRGDARAAGHRVPPAPPIAEVHGRARPPVPQAPLHPDDKAWKDAALGSDDVRARQRLVQRFREAMADARAAAIAKHGLRAGPGGLRVDITLHGGENETDLRQRLKDAGDQAEAELEHVIAVAAAEALARPEGIQWLGWNLGRSRSWDRALRSSADIARGSNKSVFDVVDDAVAEIAPPTDGDS